MKTGKAEFHRILVVSAVIFLHRIIMFSRAENPCNRTCGSKTVNYPFGFSGSCPYKLDPDCSEDGEVFLKGFKVFNFTASSIFIESSRSNNGGECNPNPRYLFNSLKQQFALTARNVLLLNDCSSNPPSDCKFNITSFLDVVSNENSSRRNCINANNMGSFYCLSNNVSGLLPWQSLEESHCSLFVTSMVYQGEPEMASISVDLDRIELRWWVDGPCSNNSCSDHADCISFRDPNHNNAVHSCQCGSDFDGDGFAEGFGCRRKAGSPNCKASGYLSGKCGKKSRVVVLICGLLAGATVVVVIVMLYCFLKRGTSALKRRRSTRRLLSANGGSMSIRIYSYRELEKATKGFSETHRLGTGSYGTVYAGKLPSQHWVAVKRIRHRDTQGIEQVLNEIKLLSSVDHPNLVRLLGCSLEKGEPILVYEFMPNGTLFQHLQRERGEGLPWRTRVTIATETARALAYLHSSINPPIYHRDVKSSNILLDYDFNSKVADFGLSRIVLTESSHISTAPQGTPGYLDPQYHQNFHLSDKSDVYSFGVVLVEIITALKVVDFSRHKSEINLASFAISKISKDCINEIVDPFLGAEADPWVRTTVHRVAELAFRCLAFDRDARPTMLEVAEELESIGTTKDTTGKNVMFSADACSMHEDNGSNLDSNDNRIMMNIMQPKLIHESKGFIEMTGTSSPASVQDSWVRGQSSPSSNGSPASVQDSWVRGQSSPSSNGFVGK